MLHNVLMDLFPLPIKRKLICWIYIFKRLYWWKFEQLPILESKDDTPQLDEMVISPSMVCSVITKLKSEKSTGPNSWPIKVIKQCSQKISIPLSIIFNKSFQSGVLPEGWKFAYISPVHKKGSRNVTSNYRLVSLTSSYVLLWRSWSQ